MCLPALVVAFFLVATAIPRWTVAPPAYDLLIRVGRSYGPAPPQVDVQFRVRDGQLETTIKPAPKDFYLQPWSLFVFDHEKLNLTPVPFNVPEQLPADAQPRTIVVEALAGRRILDQAKAPDGYEFRTETGGGSGFVGDIFGMHRYDPRASVVNRGRVIRIPLPAGYEFLSPVASIGWLEPASGSQTTP